MMIKSDIEKIIQKVRASVPDNEIIELLERAKSLLESKPLLNPRRWTSGEHIFLEVDCDFSDEYRIKEGYIKKGWKCTYISIDGGKEPPITLKFEKRKLLIRPDAEDESWYYYYEMLPKSTHPKAVDTVMKHMKEGGWEFVEKIESPCSVSWQYTFRKQKNV